MLLISTMINAANRFDVLNWVIIFPVNNDSNEIQIPGGTVRLECPTRMPDRMSPS